MCSARYRLLRDVVAGIARNDFVELVACSDNPSFNGRWRRRTGRRRCYYAYRRCASRCRRRCTPFKRRPRPVRLTPRDASRVRREAVVRAHDEPAAVILDGWVHRVQLLEGKPVVVEDAPAGVVFLFNLEPRGTVRDFAGGAGQALRSLASGPLLSLWARQRRCSRRCLRRRCRGMRRDCLLLSG